MSHLSCQFLKALARVAVQSTKAYTLTKQTTNGRHEFQSMERNILLVAAMRMKKKLLLTSARAAFKYQSDKPKKFLDLTDVPPQPPILRSRIEAGSSKYKGVYQKNQKYQVLLRMDGKNHSLDCYHDEEEAAAVYARAAFKYKPDDV